MELVARTRIVMWEGGGLWIVEATPAASRERKQTDFHAHHAIQVVVGLGGAFHLQTETDHVDGEAVAVAADIPHAFSAEGLFAILFVEPESRIGRAITARLFAGQPLAGLDATGLADWRARATQAFHAGGQDSQPIADLGRTLAQSLAGDRPGDQPDRRVRNMIARAVERIEHPLSLADVVEPGGLSAARLRHLFVEQTGLPFKTYLLWLRLTKAVERMAAGGSLTDAAHGAGFADSAHFSRTFRRMFGVAPAALRTS
jgi:AraC-like DNA-binding protein